MSRFRQGWELTKKSWALLRSNPLFRFPVYGALAALVVADRHRRPGLYLIDDEQRSGGGLLIAVGLYLGVVRRHLLQRRAGGHGRPDLPRPRGDVADGFAVARQRLGAIAGWAALAAPSASIFAAPEAARSAGDRG